MTLIGTCTFTLLRPTSLKLSAYSYVLLLYPQPENFTVDSIAPLVNASSPITLFNISEFAEATGLGLPVAGTYFLTGPDADST